MVNGGNVKTVNAFLFVLRATVNIFQASFWKRATKTLHKLSDYFSVDTARIFFHFQLDSVEFPQIDSLINKKTARESFQAGRWPSRVIQDAKSVFQLQIRASMRWKMIIYRLSVVQHQL